MINNHTCFEGLATAGLVKTPVLTTIHGGLKGDCLALFAAYEGWYNTVSRSAKALLPKNERFVGVINNAIGVAKRSGCRLIIGDNVDTADGEYFYKL